MKTLRLFSHLNGAEHLVVSKPSLNREIIGMLKDCHSNALADGGHRSIEQFLQGIGRSFDQRAQEHGWSNTSRGFEKERVAMNFLAPSTVETLSFEQILGCWLWAYASGHIDVGVKILPADPGNRYARITAENQKSSKSFESVVAEIKQLGRNTPVVPLLLIGLSLP